MATVFSYNDLIKLTHIFTTTGGGTVFSSNQASNTAFNFFSNTAVLNDAIYFGMVPSIYFGDITLDIGTPLAGTGITITWEYLNSSNVWVALTCTDNSSGFTASGIRTVTFSQPANWGTKTVNGVTNGGWIRARISAITSITNGGAQAAQTVLVKSFALTVSDPGNTVSGFCAAAYAADQANGWGVVKKQGSNSYYFNCHVFLGYSTDASATNISDTNKLIEIAGLFWSRKGNASITFGTITSDPLKASKDGVMIKAAKTLHSYFADGAGSEKWYLFSCLLDALSTYATVKIYNCVYNGAAFFTTDVSGNGVIVSNTNFQVYRPDFSSGCSCYPNSLVNGVRVSDATNAIRLEFNGYIRALNNVNCTYLGDSNGDATAVYDIVLIDPVSNTFQISWLSNPTNGGNITTRHHTINLKIADSAGTAIQNVNISVLNKNNAISVLRENGRITAGIGTAGTSIAVDTNNYSIGDYINVGAEMIKITAGTYPNYTVSRSQLGTRAANHNTGRQALKLLSSVATDVNGNSGEIQVETNRYSWASGNNPGVTTNTILGPFTTIIRKYGYIFQKTTSDILAAVVSNVTLLTNSFTVLSSAAAGALTGIAIDGNAKTITITQAHTVSELYDYAQWWASQAANMLFDEPVKTVDGIKYTLATDWSIIIDGVLLDATGKNIQTTGTGTYSIINGGDIEGTLSDVTHTHVKITAPNLIDNTRVRLYNMTLDTEVDNSVVSGGLGYIYVADIPTVNLISGNTIRLQATYCVGTAAKREVEAFGTLTINGLSFIDSQEDWTEYNSIGIDGSTITEFSSDYPNIQVDISDPDGMTTRQRFLAWWIYNLTGNNGIRYFFKGIKTEDVSNYQVDVSVIDLYFDNVTSSPVRFTDSARIYKSDGSSIIAATSGSIQSDSGKVYIAETGISGLTSAESDKLFSLPTAPQIKQEVKALTTGKFLGLK